MVRGYEAGRDEGTDEARDTRGRIHGAFWVTECMRSEEGVKSSMCPTRGLGGMPLSKTRIRTEAVFMGR